MNNSPTNEFLEQLATDRVYPLDNGGYVKVGDDLVALARELQQYRKAAGADREMLKRLAVILSGSDAPGEIKALTVTAQSFVDRCRQLVKERDEYYAATPTASPISCSEWISCREKMPEKNTSVLISVNFDSDLVQPLICSARWTGSTFRRGGSTVKPGSGIEEATHWMSLPAAPLWEQS